jgi:hypothetical protein
MRTAEIIALIFKYGPTVLSLLKQHGPEAVKIATDVVNDFVKKGHDPESAVHKAMMMLPKPQSEWTPEETQAWFDRATGNFG